MGLFQGLPRRDLRAMSARLKRQEVPAWEILIQEECPASAFYLIETGKALVVKDWGRETEEIQRELGPGEYFGEYSPLLGGRSHTTVVTTEPGVFWALPADEFSRFLKRRLGG
jgi:CRP-like cAMP-binding protein